MRWILLVLLMLLSRAELASAQFFTPDDGECAGGLFQAYKFHEDAHTLVASWLGNKPTLPANGLIPFGKSWNDHQERWPRVAKAGLIGNLWLSALSVAEGNGGYCKAFGGWIITHYYAIWQATRGERMGHLGDYWAFADRREGGGAARDWRRAAAITLTTTQTLILAVGETVAGDEAWLRARMEEGR